MYPNCTVLTIVGGMGGVLGLFLCRFCLKIFIKMQMGGGVGNLVRFCVIRQLGGITGGYPGSKHAVFASK